MKEFSKTKFVTVNFVSDWINGIKDLLGMQQKSYETVTDKTAEEMLFELALHGEIEWFRQQIDRTFDKTIQITIYGQYKIDPDKNYSVEDK